MTIDSIQVELLSLTPGLQYDLDIYTESSEGKKALSPVVFDTRLLEGFIVGNESPGVLRYNSLYSNDRSVSVGMRPRSQTPSVEIQLAPGESFSIPPVFIMIFNGEPDAAKKLLEKFVAEYIARPAQQYSVWYENVPMETTESEIRQKAQMAAKSGADIFCLTGIWMDKRGDWNARADMPLEKIGQYVQSLGMKFGLSMELAVADQDSQVLADYPQWIVSAGDNSSSTISGGKMMCLGSEYTVYAAHQIVELVKRLSLDYIRFAGRIVPDGCSDSEHMHRSRTESLWYIYEGFFALCSYLHGQNYDLIIDISNESYAPDGVLDYALLKYADVPWPF